MISSTTGYQQDTSQQQHQQQQPTQHQQQSPYYPSYQTQQQPPHNPHPLQTTQSQNHPSYHHHHHHPPSFQQQQHQQQQVPPSQQQPSSYPQGRYANSSANTYPSNRYPDPSFQNYTHHPNPNTNPNTNSNYPSYPYYPVYSLNLNGPGPGPGTIQNHNGYYPPGAPPPPPPAGAALMNQNATINPSSSQTPPPQPPQQSNMKSGISSSSMLTSTDDDLSSSSSQYGQSINHHNQQQQQYQPPHIIPPTRNLENVGYTNKEPQFASISYPSISTPQNYYYPPPNHPYAYGNGAGYQPYYDYSNTNPIQVPMVPNGLSGLSNGNSIGGVGAGGNGNGNAYAGSGPNSSGVGGAGGGGGGGKGLNPAAQGYVPTRNSGFGGSGNLSNGVVNHNPTNNGNNLSNGLPSVTGSGGGVGGVGTFVPVVVDGEKLKAIVAASSISPKEIPSSQSSGLGLTQLDRSSGLIHSQVPLTSTVSPSPAPAPAPPSPPSAQSTLLPNGEPSVSHGIDSKPSSDSAPIPDGTPSKATATFASEDSSSITATTSESTSVPQSSSGSSKLPPASIQLSPRKSAPPPPSHDTTPGSPEPTTPFSPGFTFTGAPLTGYLSPVSLPRTQSTSAPIENTAAIASSSSSLGSGSGSGSGSGIHTHSNPNVNLNPSRRRTSSTSTITGGNGNAKSKSKSEKVIVHLRLKRPGKEVSGNSYFSALAVNGLPSSVSLVHVDDEEEEEVEEEDNKQDGTKKRSTRRTRKSRKRSPPKGRRGIWASDGQVIKGSLTFGSISPGETGSLLRDELDRTPKAGSKALTGDDFQSGTETKITIDPSSEAMTTDSSTSASTLDTQSPSRPSASAANEVNSNIPPPKPKSWAALLQTSSKPFTRTQSVPSHVFSRPPAQSQTQSHTQSSRSISISQSTNASPTKSISSLPEIQHHIQSTYSPEPDANGSEYEAAEAGNHPSQVAATSKDQQSVPKPINYAAALALPPAPPSPLEDLLRLLIEGVKRPREVGPVGVARGLINMGNMCFANTILQVLLYCPPFTELFTQLAQKLQADLGRRTPLLESMILFLQECSTPFPSSSMINGASGPSSAQASSSSISGANGNASLPNGGQTSTPTTASNHVSKGSLSSSGKPVPGGSNPSVTAPAVNGNGVVNGNAAHMKNPLYGGEPFVPEYVYDAMKENKRFDSMRRGHQEDAEEYLGFFLDTLHEEILSLINRKQSSTRLSTSSSSSNGANGNSSDDWLEVGKKQKTNTVRISSNQKSTAITALFGGTLRSILHIPGTSKDSITLEPYQPLQLDIQNPSINTITDALRNLNEPEIVPGVISTPARGKVDATKQIFLESFPVVMILHLKRFVYDMGRGDVVKRHRLVGYGTELVIPPEIISPGRRGVAVKYRLFGVVYHHGSTASGGHYTVAVHRQDKSGWIHFDDESVSAIPVEDVVVSREEVENGKSGLIGGREKCAYLLFYQRVRA